MNGTKEEVKKINNQNDLYFEFVCGNCGAKFISLKDSNVTRCVFCGSHSFVKREVNDGFEPDKIIKFKKSYYDFEFEYKKYINKKLFAPTCFKEFEELAVTKGLYVPYYIYTYDLGIHGMGRAVRKDNNITQEKYFDLDFSQFGLVPVDGSPNVDDNVVTSLEPFYIKEVADYEPSILKGFQVENINETSESLRTKANARALAHTKSELQRKLGRYAFTGGELESFVSLRGEPDYMLLPLWIYNIKYKNKNYCFAMNGQTGKVSRDSVPISYTKFLITFISIFSILLFTSFSLLSGISSYEGSNYFTSVQLRIVFTIIMWIGLFIMPLLLTIKRYPVFGKKKGYKYIKNVLENRIATWDEVIHKDEKYANKLLFMKEHPNVDVSKVKTNSSVN